jgi:homoserine kinase
MNDNKIATARAPASIGNLGVGFDILGLAFGALFDEVTARKMNTSGVQLVGVDGLLTDLPVEIVRNTALRSAAAVLSKADADFGVEISITKGIPLSSGLGGSGASAVAATVAVNGLLKKPLSQAVLFACAHEGERAASDPAAPDNVASSLFGGLILARGNHANPVVQIPVPEGLSCVAVHPDICIDTAAARDLLPRTVPLTTAIDQTRCVASFLLGCYTGNLDLLSEGLRDLMVEPHRSHLVPGFESAKAAALAQGALGGSLSGSGPTTFAWCRTEDAEAVGAAMSNAFTDVGLASTIYNSPLNVPGAAIVG